MSSKEKVIIRRVPSYNSQAIQRVITEGLEELGLSHRIRGRITIKPNVVMAHHKVTPCAYTRPEFLEGMAAALRSLENLNARITVTEKCGAGIPTSRMFRRAGYREVSKRYGLRLLPIEEAKKKKIPLRKGKIHAEVITAAEIVDNDLLIYTPKLKSNALSHGLTGAVKLNIGLLLDRERMWNHNYNLDDKIVDLLEVGKPEFIATDAIEVSLGGNHLTQHAKHLGLVIMARNPVAHDAVCARIFHLDPRRVGHLRIAHERGYGPIDPEDIEISGDAPLGDIQDTTKEWDLGVIRVDEVDCNVRVLCGEPYCHGGCHGVFLDWLYMIKDRKPALWNNMPEWTVVIGKYDGDVTAERLMVIGSCSEIRGEVQARRRGRIRGCPPKHKDLVLWFFLKAGILNPLFRFDLIIDAYVCLFFAWCRRLLTLRF